MNRRQERMLRQAATRHGRRKTGLFLCEGTRCCREALLHKPQWVVLALQDQAFSAVPGGSPFRELCNTHAIELCTVSPEHLASFAETETPQGILLLMRRQDPAPLDGCLEDPFVLVLDALGDPGNLGTILRTAAAAGLHETWTTAGTTDPFGAKAVRAGMGAQFRLTLRTFADVDALRGAFADVDISDVWLTTPGEGLSCYSPDFQLRKSALVIGNEAHGAREFHGARRVTIPMPGGSESLNVAQAATILIFEGVRRGVLLRGG